MNFFLTKYNSKAASDEAARARTASAGAAALSFVIIISAVTLLMTLSLGISSITQTKAGLTREKSIALRINAEGCIDEALIRLNRNNSYAGENITLNGTACVLTVSGSGSVRTINVSAVNGDYVKTTQVGVELTPVFKITSWQEI